MKRWPVPAPTSSDERRRMDQKTLLAALTARLGEWREWLQTE